MKRLKINKERKREGVIDRDNEMERLKQKEREGGGKEIQVDRPTDI